MAQSKRELARIERRLIAALTEACEIAKSEIEGFTWLTHTADLSALANTLKVTWVFETLSDQKLAQAGTQKARIFELTAVALSEADVDVIASERNVRFDSEEECQRMDAGDWQKRLARTAVAKG
jgi:hypothetical protein